MRCNKLKMIVYMWFMYIDQVPFIITSCVIWRRKIKTKINRKAYIYNYSCSYFPVELGSTDIHTFCSPQGYFILYLPRLNWQLATTDYRHYFRGPLRWQLSQVPLYISFIYSDDHSAIMFLSFTFSLNVVCWTRFGIKWRGQNLPMRLAHKPRYRRNQLYRRGILRNTVISQSVIK